MAYLSSMSNPMSSNRDEVRSYKNVEYFGPSLSEVIETADLSNDTPADVFRNSRSRLNDASTGKFVTLRKGVDIIHPPPLAKNLFDIPGRHGFAQKRVDKPSCFMKTGPIQEKEVEIAMASTTGDPKMDFNLIQEAEECSTLNFEDIKDPKSAPSPNTDGADIPRSPVIDKPMGPVADQTNGPVINNQNGSVEDDPKGFMNLKKLLDRNVSLVKPIPAHMQLAENVPANNAEKHSGNCMMKSDAGIPIHEIENADTGKHSNEYDHNVSYQYEVAGGPSDANPDSDVDMDPNMKSDSPDPNPNAGMNDFDLIINDPEGPSAMKLEIDMNSNMMSGHVNDPESEMHNGKRKMMSGENDNMKSEYVNPRSPYMKSGFMMSGENDNMKSYSGMNQNPNGCMNPNPNSGIDDPSLDMKPEVRYQSEVGRKPPDTDADKDMNPRSPNPNRPENPEMDANEIPVMRPENRYAYDTPTVPNDLLSKSSMETIKNPEKHSGNEHFRDFKMRYGHKFTPDVPKSAENLKNVNISSTEITHSVQSLENDDGKSLSNKNLDKNLHVDEKDDSDDETDHFRDFKEKYKYGSDASDNATDNMKFQDTKAYMNPYMKPGKHSDAIDSAQFKESERSPDPSVDAKPETDVYYQSEVAGGPSDANQDPDVIHPTKSQYTYMNPDGKIDPSGGSPNDGTLIPDMKPYMKSVKKDDSDLVNLSSMNLVNPLNSVDMKAEKPDDDYPPLDMTPRADMKYDGTKASYGTSMLDKPKSNVCYQSEVGRKPPGVDMKPDVCYKSEVGRPPDPSDSRLKDENISHLNDFEENIVVFQTTLEPLEHNKTIGKGDLRAKLKSKESKNGKVDPEMDHFDDFQEKDGCESTKPPDVLPNKQRSNDFGNNQTQDEVDFGELQEKPDLNCASNNTRRECVSIGSGKIQEDKNPVMNETSRLIGRNVFLNMTHIYEFRFNIVKQDVKRHEILTSTILSSYLSFMDSFLASKGDWLALNSTNQSIHLRQIAAFYGKNLIIQNFISNRILKDKKFFRHFHLAIQELFKLDDIEICKSWYKIFGFETNPSWGL